MMAHCAVVATRATASISMATGRVAATILRYCDARSACIVGATLAVALVASIAISAIIHKLCFLYLNSLA